MRLPPLILLLITGFFLPAIAQDNTFPATGNVGIGTTSPTSKLVVEHSPADIKESYPALFHFTPLATKDGTYFWRGVFSTVLARPALGVYNRGHAAGAFLECYNDDAGDVSQLYGAYIRAGSTGNGSGKVITGAGLAIEPRRFGGSFNKWFSLYLKEPVGTAAVTDEWSLYSANPAGSFFAGTLSVGGAAKTHQLAVKRNNPNERSNYGLDVNYRPSATLDGNYAWRGLNCQTQARPNTGVTNEGECVSARFSATNAGEGNIDDLRGIAIEVGSGTSGSGNVGHATGIFIEPVRRSGTTTTYADLWIKAPVGLGEVTNDYAIYSLHDATSYLKGALGIGTRTPNTKFEVNTDAVGDGLIAGSAFVGNLDATSAALSHERLRGDELVKSFAVKQHYSGQTSLNSAPAKDLSLCIGGEAQMTVKSTGSVGIGTADPGDYKLAVNGSIRTKELVVDTDWGDHVFEPEYKLPSLDEVESYIKKHKRLPGVQSAKEIQKKGVGVANMMTKQQIKIEELTLYVIELKKQNDALQKRLEALEKKAE